MSRPKNPSDLIEVFESRPLDPSDLLECPELSFPDQEVLLKSAHKAIKRRAQERSLNYNSETWLCTIGAAELSDLI